MLECELSSVCLSCSPVEELHVVFAHAFHNDLLVKSNLHVRLMSPCEFRVQAPLRNSSSTHREHTASILCIRSMILSSSESDCSPVLFDDGNHLWYGSLSTAWRCDRTPVGTAPGRTQEAASARRNSRKPSSGGVWLFEVVSPLVQPA